jgi:hypothetical protein
VSDFDLPQTAAGAWLAWWIAMVNRGGEGADDADWDHYSTALKARFSGPLTGELLRANFQSNLARMGEITSVTLEANEPLALVALVATAKDRRWVLKLEVEPEPPHAMSGFEVERRHDFELGFREATAADAATLADIERRCPIVMGETSVHFDRGDDYMAATRLMEDCSIGLASVDGVPAAISCGAEHVVRVGGVLKTMITVSHLRVLPEHQRKGLWGAANKVLDKYRDRTDGSNAYISVDNLGMQHGFAGTPNKWPQVVHRIPLDCAALAGPPAGRSATEADAGAIVARLNAFHDAEEMFVPYTVDSFSRRMDRAPDLYAWDRIWLSDGALVGAWAFGNALRMITEVGGVRTVSRSGVVLDYAFAPGADAEFEALLRAWCGHLAGEGFDTLVIYTSPASPGAALLERLGRDTERFFMWTPGIEVPDGAETRGLYVDAVYF